MSPRPRNSRTVFDPPKFKGFRPYGYYAGKNERVSLLFEEYTAIKLCDYELMTQSEAAQTMNISRPTFTRLYETARRKIAQALAEARTIELERGHACFGQDWFHCQACGVFFSQTSQKPVESICPLCHAVDIEKINKIFKPDENGHCFSK